ncbi:hypothetical protein I7I48_00033 [Histoplasma ohiense]|nr:hypothetical protein I7I48_00033 [Histoplasma ohiense (nom. inval.)]
MRSMFRKEEYDVFQAGMSSEEPTNDIPRKFRLGSELRRIGLFAPVDVNPLSAMHSFEGPGECLTGEVVVTSGSRTESHDSIGECVGISGVNSYEARCQRWVQR